MIFNNQIHLERLANMINFIIFFTVSTSWELLASKMDTTTLKGLLCEKDYTG